MDDPTPLFQGLLIFQVLLLQYPLYWELSHLMIEGMQYLDSAWNYLDILHCTVGFTNAGLQYLQQPQDLCPKLALILVILISLFKLFFFLRIYDSLSYIVTMIFQVIKDLQAFITFFFSLIFICAMVFNSVGINQQKEYHKVGPFAGSFFYTLRLSLGDFDFSILDGEQITPYDNILFWIVWLVTILFSLLIFLNFIIAEVSNSYETVRASIQAMLYRERASLIAEAESLINAKTRRQKPNYFPRYLIAREVEY